jgi:acetyl esterase/lipase
MQCTSSFSRLVGCTLLLTFGAAAQTQTIKIWPGVAPGSENWTEKEEVMKSADTDRVLNITTPTLTVYVPEKSKATGTGIIIAPGGGFSYLAIDKEGRQVARWLQEKGIAGFVLKYRVRQMTPAEVQPLKDRRSGRAVAPPAGTSANSGTARSGGANMDDAGKYGIADGIQALKVVRERAGEWGLSPDRIGIVGFSAGAMVASAVLLQEEVAARPAFAALIYGGPFGAMPTIPQNLPPVFLAWAQDDRLAGKAVTRFYTALKAAGNDPEVHIYKSGGHGFGMDGKDTTAEHWIDEFYWWLEVQRFTEPVPK